MKGRAIAVCIGRLESELSFCRARALPYSVHVGGEKNGRAIPVLFR
jgi:hypothetical protein